MAYITRFLLYAGFILFLITGCSGKGNPSAPDTVSESGDQVLMPELTAGREVSEYKGSHFPLFHNLIYMNVTDPENVEYEIVPLREGFFHLNILKFLEVSPCTDCFEIVGFSYPEPGIINVDFKITHPYDDPLYTIFDVRGIMMFDGSHTFSSSGLTISVPWLGDGTFLNPDGYTSLYNTWSLGVEAPDIRKYFQGNYATVHMPDSLVNGYIRHISDDPANTRNALFAGDSVIRTYSLKYPTNEFVFGYAVDVSWAEPIETPVDDPMEDFGLNASSPEPWKIDIIEFGEGLSDEGGILWLQIDVYDWGGKETHDLPVVECSELFDGEKIAGFISETDDFARFHVALHNENLTGGGYYNCLISVQDHDYNPNFPWIDMKSYQVTLVRVSGKPIAIAHGEPIPQTINQPVHFWGTDSLDMDGGEITYYEWDWDNDGVYDETGPEVWHTWSANGYYEVQLRVTDDEGDTDELDIPLGVPITGPNAPTDPTYITPDWMNLRPEGVYMDGNMLYVTANPPSLHLIDISDPYNPSGLGSIDLPGIDSVLTASDGYAYVVSREYGPSSDLFIIDVDPPSQMNLVQTLTFDRLIRDIEVKDGYIYVGRYKYFSIFNAINPESPYVVAEYEMGQHLVYDYFPYNWHYEDNIANSIAFVGDFAYLSEVGGGSHKLHKYNISNPESPFEDNSFFVHGSQIENYDDHLVMLNSSEINIWDPNLEPDGLINTYPLSIYSKDWWVDPAGIIGITESPYPGSLQLFDTDPLVNLHLVNEFSPFMGAVSGQNGLGCVVYRPYIVIWDTDPPESAFITAELEFPDGVYSIDQWGEYLYLGSSSGIEIYDIEPLENAYKLGELPLDGYIKILIHEGNYLYVSRYKIPGKPFDFFHIIDISNPEEPFNIITFDGMRVRGISGGYAYAKTPDGDLSIIDIDPPESAYEVKAIYLEENPIDLAFSNGYAYGTADGELLIFDVDPPEDISLVNSVQYGNGLKGYALIELQGSFAYVVEERAYNEPLVLLVFDISVPTEPIPIHSIQLPDIGTVVTSFMISNNYGYITRGEGFNIIDISSPENTYVINTTYTSSGARDTVVKGDSLFVGTLYGIEVYDLW